MIQQPTLIKPRIRVFTYSNTVRRRNSQDFRSANPIFVTMDQNHTLKAVFMKIQVVGDYSVSLTKTNSRSELACYATLIAIFGVMVSITKKQKKVANPRLARVTFLHS